MAARFDRDGMSFSYPENWNLECEDTPAAGPLPCKKVGTPLFCCCRITKICREPEEVAQTTLEAMRAEYPDLESDEVVESLAGQTGDRPRHPLFQPRSDQYLLDPLLFRKLERNGTDDVASERSGAGEERAGARGDLRVAGGGGGIVGTNEEIHMKITWCRQKLSYHSFIVSRSFAAASVKR